jgi:hypothetical protein
MSLISKLILVGIMLLKVFAVLFLSLVFIEPNGFRVYL